MDDNRPCPKCEYGTRIYYPNTGRWSAWCKDCTNEYYRTKRNTDSDNAVTNNEWSIVRRANSLGLDLLVVINAYREWNKECNTCNTHVDELTKSIHVDHDHNTGTFRGFLCFSCNIVLGHVQDNTDTLSNMIEYLRS